MSRWVVPLIVLAAFASRVEKLLAADASVQASQVDSLFSSQNNQTSPGCAVAIMKDGRVAYEHGYGMADLDHSVKLSPATVFYVGSMSKQFTAAAILTLVQDGKISLDDPIRKHSYLIAIGLTEEPQPCTSLSGAPANRNVY
jgi:CubicO group peptidase (beta-lactamase class C family)